MDSILLDSIEYIVTALRNKYFVIFITRWHAERDIVVSFLSVCPSVSPTNADTVSK